jgi:hypothetical protein
MMNSMPEYPRTGRDWCWTDITTVKEVVGDLIGAPSSIEGLRNRLVTNDNFRNPSPKDLTTYPHKIAVWL